MPPLVTEPVIVVVPPSRFTSPPRLFEPERVSIPALVLVRLPEPEILPEIVVLEAPATVSVLPALSMDPLTIKLPEAALKVWSAPRVSGRLTVWDFAELLTMPSAPRVTPLVPVKL